jgi:hypothetical protein
MAAIDNLNSITQQLTQDVQELLALATVPESSVQAVADALTSLDTLVRAKLGK